MAQEIGFLETYSLAPDREAALKQLVPGTDDYFYFHALQAQTTGQREKFQEIVDKWIHDRNGRVLEQARELLNRQALLDYERTPDKSLAYLREQLNLTYPHARKTGERKSDAPLKLDQALIDPAKLLATAMNADKGSLERVEDAGLELAAAKTLTGEQRRNLLGRLRRPDLAGLVDLIAEDLKFRDSGGFGSLEIHQRLTLAQMEELLRKDPGLRNQGAFCTAYLARLAPPNEVDLASDRAARKAWLERLWTFARSLDPVHNSLKAQVLYHLLSLDREQGEYPRDRFMEYLKLPRNVPYLRDEIRRQLPRGDHLAVLDQSFGGEALAPVRNEEPLVRDFLLNLLRDAPNDEDYRPWLNDNFLKKIFAESKIVNGIGDPQQWAPLLTPEEYQRLKERVDIDFATGNPAVVGPEDAIRLGLFLKNTPALLIKVYEINTLNYYRQSGRPLDLALNLDGLVASSERRTEYKDGPERRIARTFDFPELKGRGVYVIEFISNGKSSRTLVQKGRLGVLQEITASGHAFTVLDEAGVRVPGARAWLAGRELLPGADGRILAPFTAEPRGESLVVQAGSFASLISFQHLEERYELRAGVYVDRESLLRREKAQVAVRAALLSQDRPVSLKLLENPRLAIRCVDLRGIVTEKEFASLPWRDDAETLCDFLVPENTTSVTVTLKASVQNLSRNRKDELSTATTFDLNGIDAAPAVQALHASHTAAGYLVELRGKNGEPLPGESLSCTFKHHLFRNEIHTTLQTDADGRVSLGELAGIDWFQAREPAGHEERWNTTRSRAMGPARLHGPAGQVLRVALANPTPAALGEISLLEWRGGRFVKDWHDALAVADGFLELRNLPAGDYSLYLKAEDREIPVAVTDGKDQAGFTMSSRRALERPRLAPLQIVSVENGADTLDVHLANVTPFTRVHLFATRYLPAFDAFGRLSPQAEAGLIDQVWQPARTLYESGRDIGDEYRYILDRQSARKFPGNLLERPGLLLNPWALRDTSAQAEHLAAGDNYNTALAAMAAPMAAPASAAAGLGAPRGSFASLDFLKEPAWVMFNVIPDAEGLVKIPKAALKGKPQLRVLAVDPLGAVLRDLALDDSPVQTRELRFAGTLDVAKAYAEQNLITPLAAKAGLKIDDAATARFEICDTVAKACRLLATLNPDPTFKEFGFIANWPDLSAEEKKAKYSQYACHELSFFLFHKDPEFFRATIAPYLLNKRDKTFLDHWLLGEDLKGYLEPWRFGRLNVVEQILLARRLAEQGASITREIKDLASLIPPNIEDFNRRFDTALQTSAVETDVTLLGELEELRRKDADKKAEGKLALADAAFGFRSVNGPVTAAAPRPAFSGIGGGGGGMGGGRGAGRAEAAGERAVLGKALQTRRLAAPAGAARDQLSADGRAPEGVFLAYQEENRQGIRRFFQKLDHTKEWAENNYHHLPIEQQLAELVTVNDFWADFALHGGTAPFLSPAFPQATRNFTEMMLAVALLDLPFKAGVHEEKLDGIHYTIQTASPVLVFHREIVEARRSAETGRILVAQHFFRADDRTRQENNETVDRFVTDEFLPQVVYGGEVVLTNPGGSRQRLAVLLQIPLGAIPVSGGFNTRGAYVNLEPYSTQKLEYFFYFPKAGKFPHYPAAVSRNAEVVAEAPPFTFNVVDQLTRIDKTSWAWISQNGSPEETLAFLETANLHRLNLDDIAWRMKDKAWFGKAIALLNRRHTWSQTLWSYGLLHGDQVTLGEYLRHSPFADRCGLRLVSPVLTLEPVERYAYQHLEYAPLVNARAHQVGARPKILNAAFREQYLRFLKVLSYQPAPGAEDKLALTIYLALQDRIGEAIDWFTRTDRAVVAEKLQYDYLEACLDLYRGDVAAARKVAVAHSAEGVDRWRNRFAQVISQLDEIDGGAAAAADRENRDQAQGVLAATEPALEMKVEAGQIRLDYRNLTNCVVNFYPMDIELLFSRSPFVQDGATQFSFIRPVLSQTVPLPAKQDALSVPLPAEFKTRNVMVETTAAGIRKTQAYYANTLRAQWIENYGQVVVSHGETRKPVAGAYVKVYSRTTSGEVKFFKDGYTDLRGRFDYASLNTNELEESSRLAILVLSPEWGAVVHEAAPPKR